MERILRYLGTGIAAFCLGFIAVECAGEAHEEVTEEQVYEAVKTLQPAHSPPVAAAWAGTFYEAGRETGLDPLLLTAIAFRESSLRADTVGALGEVGAMQLLGVAKSYRPRRCDVQEMGCNVRAGAAFLLYCRAHCGEPWDVWIGAYGTDHCPSLEEAQKMRSVRRAKELYLKIGGDGWM